MGKEFLYDAFISYRHTNLDKIIADRLQRLLEKYVPPASVNSEKKGARLHLFRDETELPTSNNLSEDIKNALEDSRFLIVVCSKTTAQSKWCMQEITYFKELHGGSTKNIITLLTEGEPSEVFPHELCSEMRVITNSDGSVHVETVEIEPLAANVAAPTVSESLKKLKREYLRIAAPLLGCGYDALYNRNQKRIVRRVIMVAAMMMVVFSAFGTFSGIMLYQMNANYRELQIKDSQYLSKESLELFAAGDRISAINTALEALPIYDRNRPLVAQAEYALSNALYSYQEPMLNVDRLLKHKSKIEQIAYSSNGGKMLSRDSANYLYIWDVRTGSQLACYSAILDFSCKEIISFVVSTDDLLYVVLDKALVCIDINEAAIIWQHTFKEITDEGLYVVKGALLSPDNSTLAIYTYNAIVFISTYDVRLINTIEPSTGNEGWYLDNTMCFSKDSQRLYISMRHSNDTLVDLLDLTVTFEAGDFESLAKENHSSKFSYIDVVSGNITTTELLGNLSVEGIRREENDLYLLLYNYDQKKAVLTSVDVTTHALVWSYEFNCARTYNKMEYIGKVEATEVFDVDSVLCVYGEMVIIVDAKDGTHLSSQAMGDDIVFCAVANMSGDGNQVRNRAHMIVADGSIVFFNFVKDWLPNAYGRPFEGGISLSNADFNKSDGNDYALVQHNSNNIILVKYLGGECTAEIPVDGSYDIAFSSDGQLLLHTDIVASDKKMIYVKAISSAQQVLEIDFNIGDRMIQNVSFDRKNNVIIATAEGAYVYDLVTGSLIRQFDLKSVSNQPFSADVTTIEEGVIFSDGQSIIKVGTDDMTYDVYDVGDYYVRNVIADRTGRVIIGYLADYSNGGSLLALFKNTEEYSVLDDSFVASGNSLVSCWADNAILFAAIDENDVIKIYNVKAGKYLAEIAVQSANMIGFTPDSCRLLVMCNDGILYEYSVADGELVRQLKLTDVLIAFSSSASESLEFIKLHNKYYVILPINYDACIVELDSLSVRDVVPNYKRYNQVRQEFVVGAMDLRCYPFYSTEALIEKAKDALLGQ